MTSSSDGAVFYHALLMRCGVGKVFEFHHKIMINVQDSPLSIVVT